MDFHWCWRRRPYWVRPWLWWSVENAVEGANVAGATVLCKIKEQRVSHAWNTAGENNKKQLCSISRSLSLTHRLQTLRFWRIFRAVFSSYLGIFTACGSDYDTLDPLLRTEDNLLQHVVSSCRFCTWEQCSLNTLRLSTSKRLTELIPSSLGTTELIPTPASQFMETRHTPGALVKLV